MISDRLGSLPDYAFPRLRTLLGDTAPGNPALDFSLGEPQHAPPPFLQSVIDENFGEYRRYPPNDDPDFWREPVSAWVERRYGVPASRFEQDMALQPLNGTREGMFMTVLALCPSQKDGRQPAVLMPNVFYPCYAAATLAAGAEPVFLRSDETTGNLPDLDQPADLWRRTAILFICSPSNPQGAIASLDYWKQALALAEQYDFRIFADECYSEIYRGDAPVGVMQALRDTGADPERVIAFHSLSKRSNLAGLRSGFAAGGRGSILALRRLKSYGGAPIPLPLLRASAAAWADEQHVVENRRLYDRKFAIADRLFTNQPSYRSPKGGFFLWLPVKDSEAAALALWRTEGVKALPGAYLSRPDTGGRDPGTTRLRFALVGDDAQIQEGLSRLVQAEGVLDRT